MKELHGIGHIIEFCAFLQEHNIHFSLDMYANDGITVTLTLVGARIEVEFQQNKTSYSVFRGHEDVEDDLQTLLALIKEDID